MALSEGKYCFTNDSGKINVYTYKEGMLSAVAHDLLLEVTGFEVNMNVPSEGISNATVRAEIKSDSLKVICAMKDGQQQPTTLKEKDISEIEEAMNKDVLHPKKFPVITFESNDIKEKNGLYHITGTLNLHGVTKTIEFDSEVTDKNIKGTVSLLQKDFGIKPYKALLGTLKVKNEVSVGFEFTLQ